MFDITLPTVEIFTIFEAFCSRMIYARHSVDIFANVYLRYVVVGQIETASYTKCTKSAVI